jgi:formate hydrogenlyase subunit 3/multisubunit Na+/H+ antiporter MnhD subunit
MTPDLFGMFLAIAFTATFGALAVLCGIVLVRFIVRGEGSLRGVHLSRQEDPIGYWFNAFALGFLFVVTAGAAGVLALLFTGNL